MFSIPTYTPRSCATGIFTTKKAINKKGRVNRLDTIYFEKKIVKSNVTWKPLTLAVLIINGRPLAEIAEHYEREAARNSKRKYYRFGYMYRLANGLYRELTGDLEFPHRNNAVLMVCDGCEEAGCRPFAVTIKETETEVIWSNFHNWHMSEPNDDGIFWDYSVFPIFRFEKTQYMAALAQLKIIADEIKITTPKPHIKRTKM